MGNSQSHRGRLAAVEQDDEELGQPAGKVEEGGIGDVIGGTPQASAQHRYDMKQRLRPFADEGQEVTARDEKQLRRIAGLGGGGASLAVEQRNLAEESARIEEDPGSVSGHPPNPR